MDDLETIIVLIFSACVFGGISSLIARTLKFNKHNWFFLGVVLGPIALLALVSLPESWLIREADD